MLARRSRRRSRSRRSRSRRSQSLTENYMDYIFKKCKQWNNKENKQFHVVCKGGAHLTYKISDLTTTDIDLVIYTRDFRTINQAQVRIFCNYLLRKYTLTTSMSLYTMISENMPIDIVVVDEDYLIEEAKGSSIIYDACNKLNINMSVFFQSLYDQNKLFPPLVFEQKQCEAGMELYDFFIERVQRNSIKKRDGEYLTEKETSELLNLDNYYKKYLAYETKLQEVTAKLTDSDYDTSDEAIL